MKLHQMTSEIPVIDTKLNLPLSDYHETHNGGMKSDKVVYNGNCNDVSVSTQVIKQKNISNDNARDPETQVYKRRYWMLFVLFLSLIYNNLLYTQHVSIASITACYYGVTLGSIKWTYLLFSIIFVLFSFPASMVIDRFGLRLVLIAAAFLNALCSAVMFAALDPDGFPMVLVSAAASSLAFVLIFPSTSRLAAQWFPASEVTRAYTVGFHANTVGQALGFVYSPLIISNDCSNKPLIYHGKATVTYSLTGATLFILVLTSFTFQNKPKRPPSVAEIRKENVSSISFKETMLKMITNYHFILITISSGFTFAAYNSLTGLLNALVIGYFPGEEAVIGVMGAIMGLAAIVSSVGAGYILDHYHKFKEISVGMCWLSFFSYALFTGLLELRILWIQYVTLFCIGFFLRGYVPISFEYGVEITYPLSETTCNSFLTNMGMIFSFALISAGTWVIENYGPLKANFLFCIILLISSVATCFIKSELKRTKSNSPQ